MTLHSVYRNANIYLLLEQSRIFLQIVIVFLVRRFVRKIKMRIVYFILRIAPFIAISISVWGFILAYSKKF